MKKRLIRGFACAALALAMTVSSAVVPYTPAAAATQTITLKTSSKTLYVGETFQLESYGTTQAITWKSGKTSVATVSKTGLVKAVKAGTAKITATSNGKEYTCTIKVINTSVDKTAVSLPIGGTERVSVTGTTIKSVKSSAASKATVTAADTYCTIRGIAKGTATVTITCTNGKSYKVKATVTEPYVVSSSETTVDFGGKGTVTKESFTYDKYGNIASHKTAKENGSYELEKSTYYADRSVKTQDIYEYSAEGVMVTGTETEYDESGNMTSVKTYYDGILSSADTYVYDMNGKMTALSNTIYEGGAPVYYVNCDYEYDMLGRMTRKSTSSAYETTVNEYAFNEYGLPEYENEYVNGVLHYTLNYYYVGVEPDTESSEEAYTYKQKYEVKSYSDGTVKGSEVALDENGRVISVVADNKLYEYGYDKSGNIVSEKETGTNLTRLYKYEYDKSGNLVLREFYLNDELLITGRWAYDKAGRVTLEDSDSYTERFITETEYDSKGRVVSSSYRSIDKEDDTEFSGVTTYTYDTNGRLTRMSAEDDGEMLITEYTYNTYGLCTKEVTTDDEGIQVSKREYKYDKLGNMTSDTYTVLDILTSDSSTKIEYTTTRTYDTNSHLLTEKIVNGKHAESSEYTYSGDEVVSFKHTVTDNKEVTSLEEETKDASGNVTLYSYQDADGSEKTVNTYNTKGLLTKTDSTVVKEGTEEHTVTEYTYDKSGNCLTEKITKDGEVTATATRTFDSQGRITSLKDSKGTVTYTYDKTSGLVKKQVIVTGNKTETVTYTYKKLLSANK